MRRYFIAVLILLCTLALTGCFEIEQNINLNKDLSGTADFHLGVDMEPMVVIMAQVGREMEGKKGPMTAAEIAKAKAEFKKSMTTKKSEEKQPTKEEMAKDLPKGVKLLDFKSSEKEFGMAMDMKLGFDKLASLVNVKLPEKKGAADPTQKNVIDTPFEGLLLTEKGDTITIQTKPTNPAEKVNEQAAEAGPKPDPEMEKMMKDAMSKLRVVYRINAPFTIVSHNAMRKEGNTLIWEYNLETFEKMQKSKKMDDMAVKVTYRK